MKLADLGQSAEITVMCFNYCPDTVKISLQRGKSTSVPYQHIQSKSTAFQ